jgi:hypothetical protein
MKRLNDLRLIDRGQNCSTGFSAGRCKWLCKWLSQTMQVGCKWLASGLSCYHLQENSPPKNVLGFLEIPKFVPGSYSSIAMFIQTSALHWPGILICHSHNRCVRAGAARLRTRRACNSPRRIQQSCSSGLDQSATKWWS